MITADELSPAQRALVKHLAAMGGGVEVGPPDGDAIAWQLKDLGLVERHDHGGTATWEFTEASRELAKEVAS